MPAASCSGPTWRAGSATLGHKQSLDAATGWILHSGSVEHLCVYHLVRARIAFRAQDFGPAQLAVDEGLRLARERPQALSRGATRLCAELFLAESQPQAAEQAAREVRAIASAPECQYQWGRHVSDHLLGHALLAQAPGGVRAALETARSLRKMLGDPRVEQTERLLRGWRDRVVESAEPAAIQSGNGRPRDF